MTLGVVNGVLEATRYLPQVYSSYVNKGSGSLSYVRFFLCIGGGLGATIQKLVLGAFYTLVPIRPRSRGERRSLRTFAVVPLRPGSLAFDPLAFDPRPRRLSTPPRRGHIDVAAAARRARVGGCHLRHEPVLRPQVRSIHWSPYDRVGVVNAVP